MSIISKTQINSTTGTYQIAMPSGGQFQFFDFQNDSPYQVAVVFGADTKADSADIDMLPNTIVEKVTPPSNSQYSIGGLWGNGPLFVYVSLPPGGSVSAAQAPAQVLTIIGHSQGYVYPNTIALNRFQGVSNPSLNTNGGNVASNLNNTNNAAATNVVVTSPTGDTQNTFTLDNEANMVSGDTMHPGSTSLSNGAFKVDGSGNTTVMNLIAAINGSIELTDNTGLVRTAVTLNQFTNNNTLLSNVNNEKIDITSSSGVYNGGWDNNAGSFSIGNFLDMLSTATVTNGTTAGTTSIWIPANGPGLKVVILHNNGYNNTTAPQQVFSLPLFTTGAWFYIGGIVFPTTSGCYFQLNGVAVGTNAAKMGSANSASSGRVQCFSTGEVLASFNQIKFDGTLSGPAIGNVLIVGI